MDHDAFRRAAAALAARRNASPAREPPSWPIPIDRAATADDYSRSQAYLRATREDSSAWLRSGWKEFARGDAESTLSAFHEALPCTGREPASIIEARRGAAISGGDPVGVATETRHLHGSVDASPSRDASTALDRETWCLRAQSELRAAIPALRTRRMHGGRREALELADVLDALGEIAEARCIRARDALIQGSHYQALRLFNQAEACGGITAGYFADYLHALRRMGRGKDALSIALRAATNHLHASPERDAVYAEWADALLDERQTESANSLLKNAAESTGSAMLRVKRCLLLPPVSASADSVASAIAQLEQGVPELESMLELGSPQPDAVLATALEPLFHLGYQIDNPRVLQRRYAHLVGRCVRKLHPLAEESASNATALASPSRRLRIGYATGVANSHTVTRYFAGWLQHADREQFEIHLFPLASVRDWMTDYLAGQVDVMHPAVFDVTAASAQIRSAALDVLVYLEVGMDRLTFHLATLRLAPVQCAAWGHPLSTEMPSIDWFISAEGMDSEADASHYSEQLLLLPGIGVCVPAPRAPPDKPDRASLGFSESDQLILSPQSLFKYRPQHDALLAGLLVACPRALLVFFEGEYPAWTETFRQRLATACTAVGVCSDKRIRFLPRQKTDGFLGINAICDICWDPPGWSGGMTSLDALACGLPVITLPGATMRSRQSAAMLNQLGVTELIAADEQDRLRIVSRLLDDPSWREQMRQRIRDGHPRLFGDQRGLRGLEAFYRWVTCVPRTDPTAGFTLGKRAC